MDALTTTLAAVADPTRRSILRRLAAGPASVGDIARPFRMSQQAVSKHLACLQRARLVKKRRVGRLSVCSLEPAPLQAVADFAEGYRALWEGNFARLDKVLDELQQRDERRRPRP